jgi:TonB-linked SusC/RagA family outer membrane protein
MFAPKALNSHPYLKQILLRMRMTVLLLMTVLMHAHASGVAQNVTLSGKELSLKQVFAELKRQTGYVFFNKKGTMTDTRPVSLKVDDMPLPQVLDLVLKNQPVTYLIQGKTVLVYRKDDPIQQTSSYSQLLLNAAPPAEEVKGYVKDSTGMGLLGATVKLKGSGKRVVTDASGKFSIQAKQGDILVVSYTGFNEKEVSIGTQPIVYVIMQQNPSVLDEVMIIAYGTTSKRLTTSSTSTVKAEDIEKQPVTNALLALQGRMPGVIATQSNGVAGSKVTIQVRGQNFLGADRNQPLYVIDGVPFPSISANRAVPNPSSAVVAMDGAYVESSPMNAVSPNDIESIDVLKDADATAIYGSRGANGVILITTKKGRKGKAAFGVNVKTGYSKVGHMMDLLSAGEFLKLRKIAYANAGTTPDASTGFDLVNWSQTDNFNFPKMLIGNTAKSTDANVSLSGGDAKNKYLISGTYHKETTVFPGDNGYKRVSVLLNNDHTSLDNRLSVNTSVQYSTDKNNVPYADLTSAAYNLPPNFPIYNADGSYNWTLGINPFADKLRSFDNKTTNLVGHMQLRYTIIPGLDAKVSAGYNRINTDQVVLLPAGAYNPSNGTKSTSRFTSSYIESFIVEPQLSYSKAIGKGKLNVLAGGSWQSTANRMPYYLFASGYTSDELITDPAAAATRSVYTSSSQYKYVSAFSRVTYNWRDKYVMNATFRRDGSSRFGPDSRFGNFGSLGAAWIFSEEKFARQYPWLSFGKLRTSYGLAGSDQIKDFAYLSLYTASTAYGAASTLIPNLASGIPNKDFHWEQTKKLEAAMDLGFFKDKIMLNVAWFRNRSNNQLVSFPLSPQTGTTSYQANMPALVQNTGWEFSINTVNLTTKSLKFTSALNLTIPRNKLISYPGLTSSAYANSYVEGYSLNSIFLYQSIGVNKTTGLQEILDADGSGKFEAGINANGKGDYMYAGTSYAKYYGGLNNSLSYKGIQLDVFIQFTKQLGRMVGANYPPGLYYNMSKELANKYLGTQENWANNPGITNQFTGAYTAYNLWSASDATVTDASFIRLKNVSLSYSLPDALMKKWHMQTIRFYLQGQNLVTITGYKGYDPETQGTVLPPLRTLTAGLQITL